MKSFKPLLLLLLLLLVSRTVLLSQINDIKVFLEQCPTNDPMIDTILKDFEFRVDDQVITEFPCTEPVSSMSIDQYTQPLIYLQTLRVAYYMDRNMTDHLPWTDTTLYVWMKNRIDGIKVSSSMSSGGYCCDYDDGKTLVVVNNADEFNRNFDKAWRGISGNLDFVAHEVRHLDGPFYHTNCCSSTSCDSIYDEKNLSCFGVQYWLNKNWLSGFLNVGIRVSHTPEEIQQILDWHLSALNLQFRERFCYNAPDLVSLDDFENPLGTSVESPESIGISIYPNPSGNMLYIKNQNTLKNAEIILTDLSGRIIRKYQHINVAPLAEYGLNVSDLDRGHYMLMLKLQNQTLNYKFIKD
jgi:hypothetical protein